MATVLAVSSFVARGTVGLRAIMPAYARMGHEVVACPTILLSNHLGHPRWAGRAVAPEILSAMLDALDENGWLAEVDAVQTGFLPTPDHVAIVETLIGRVRALRPDAMIVCDPVLGDQPGGLYVPQGVAEAVRARLVPIATHIKPNLFELALLSGRPVDDVPGIVAAARALAVPVVLASSIPVSRTELANLVVTAEGAGLCTVARQSDVPHGTGDLLTALFTAHSLAGEDPFASAARAAAGVAHAIRLSEGSDELQLAHPAPWHASPPLATVTL